MRTARGALGCLEGLLCLDHVVVIETHGDFDTVIHPRDTRTGLGISRNPAEAQYTPSALPGQRDQFCLDQAVVIETRGYLHTVIHHRDTRNGLGISRNTAEAQLAPSILPGHRDKTFGLDLVHMRAGVAPQQEAPG